MGHRQRGCPRPDRPTYTRATRPVADSDADPDGVIIAAAIVLFSLIGVIATVFAYHQGRVHGRRAGMPLYWFGQILVVRADGGRGTPAPAAAVRCRRYSMAVGLGVNQYLIMWLYSPDQFRFPDELQHMTATAIVNHTGRLFQDNPLCPSDPHSRAWPKSARPFPR